LIQKRPRSLAERNKAEAEQGQDSAPHTLRSGEDFHDWCM